MSEMSEMRIYWETKDGTLIDPRSMSDEHLVNAYNLFKDSGDRKRLDVLESELERRYIMFFNEVMEEKDLKEQGYINTGIKIERDTLIRVK